MAGLILTYTPLPDGGVKVDITYNANPVAGFELSHDGALGAAAQILHKAGVARAEFEGTRIQEMTRP
jgi:hypothetical protein